MNWTHYLWILSYMLYPRLNGWTDKTLYPKTDIKLYVMIQTNITFNLNNLTVFYRNYISDIDSNEYVM